jgi:hypothetical protein
MYLIDRPDPIVTEAPDRDDVRRAVRHLLQAGLVNLARLNDRQVLVPVSENVLDDLHSWDPRAGQGLLIYATELGEVVLDSATLGPSGPHHDGLG